MDLYTPNKKAVRQHPKYYQFKCLLNVPYSQSTCAEKQIFKEQRASPLTSLTLNLIWLKFYMVLTFNGIDHIYYTLQANAKESNKSEKDFQYQIIEFSTFEL